MVNKLKWLERNPVEAVIFIVSLGLFIYSIIAMTPFYTAANGNVLEAGLPWWGGWISSGYFALASIPGLIAPFNKRVPNVWLEWGTFSMFLSYLFLTIMRVVLYGWFPLTWFSLLVVSFACGALRIYLRSHRNE